MTLENRSLERGLMVLEALSRDRALSLADLHKVTGLPKSTLRRLLGTLVARRAVRRSVADGLYRSNVVLPMGAGQRMPATVGPLVDHAMPHVLELTRRIQWPSDLHMVSDLRMTIVDSTRPASPFHLYPGRLHRQLNIFGSASGMACLAALPEAHVDEIARRTAEDVTWGLARFGLSVEAYREHLEATRARGYGVRLGTYLGETVLDDRLWAIAVPVRQREAVVGAITLIWPRDFSSPEDFAATHLRPLEETADAVTDSLSALSRE
ncbi:helix-turn-helix domain-containing protein [Tranquillimonas alkanivorans]|uniref:Transcriptional regulator, IclR family n=1 Tax=Tranquillimonas alkanivorans TaxID=441119 RepID=A0A1I5VLY9_9RHOB|nr:helix-turn-helix domain-containing protein [Tranquillimonas alkanivorans]SFQ07996.1 transcriptional regulator, IclR family [Tranquillimonas alkanivorans]